MADRWIGVDLDGTLADHTATSKWHGPPPWEIGDPIRLMVERVKKWLAEGRDVRIVTARISEAFRIGNAHGLNEGENIKRWCDEHLGARLPVTATKDFGMVELWDDRAIQLIPDTGIRADGKE